MTATPTPTPPMTMLGFHNVPANWDSFWVGVASGMVYSAIVGLVVGIAIYLIQRANENRRFERECEAEIAGLVSRMRTGLMLPQLKEGPNLTDARPVGGNRVVALIQEYSRVALWRAVLPKFHPLYDAIDLYEDAYMEYMNLVNGVRMLSGNRLTRYLKTHRGAEIRDRQFTWLARRYILGLLIGDDEESVSIRVGATQENQAVLRDIYSFISEDLSKSQRYSNVISDLRAAREREGKGVSPSLEQICTVRRFCQRKIVLWTIIGTLKAKQRPVDDGVSCVSLARPPLHPR